jgi:hypothetical protein
LLEVLVLFILLDVKSGTVIVLEAKNHMALACEVFQYRGKRGHSVADTMSEYYRNEFHGLFRAALGDFGWGCTDLDILPDTL